MLEFGFLLRFGDFKGQESIKTPFADIIWLTGLENYLLVRSMNTEVYVLMKR